MCSEVESVGRPSHGSSIVRGRNLDSGALEVAGLVERIEARWRESIWELLTNAVNNSQVISLLSEILRSVDVQRDSAHLVAAASSRRAIRTSAISLNL